MALGSLTSNEMTQTVETMATMMNATELMELVTV